MNRILFESSEISNAVVTIDGPRATHILTVLHGEVGQILKTGEVNGLIGTSEILAIEGARVTLKTDHRENARAPWIDLILAPPRPRIFKRLLPQLATLGVDRLVLVGAKKVEKDFWGATILKDEVNRPLLIDGLMQAGTSALPRIFVRRNFREFLSAELDENFQSRTRFVAHPLAHVSRILRADGEAKIREKPILAIGPEGGWTDDEISRLEEKGFSRFSLGARILRTDTATIALLARLGALYDNDDEFVKN